MTQIKNIKEVTEPLKEQILKGDVHSIAEMWAWLKPFGYSETKCWNSYQPSDIRHQTSYFSHQPSLRLYHHRDLIGSPSAFIKSI